LTPWELAACVQGWNEAHGAETTPPVMSDARFEQLKADAGVI
jgi:hypothetical protein